MQIFKSAKKTVLGAMSVNDQAVEQAKCPFHNTSPMKRAVSVPGFENFFLASSLITILTPRVSSVYVRSRIMMSGFQIV